MPRKRRMPRDDGPVTPEEAFGVTLRALREERGLSQEGLAFASGYHHTYIGLLERGRKSPSLGTLYRLAQALEVTPSELLHRAQAIPTAIPPRRGQQQADEQH